MSKYPPFQHTAEYWRSRYVALANKVYRQRLYYQSVSRQVRSDLELGRATPAARPELEAMATQLDKNSADMDFIFTKACAGLPPVEVLRITAGTQT